MIANKHKFVAVEFDTFQNDAIACCRVPRCHVVDIDTKVLTTTAKQ